VIAEKSWVVLVVAKSWLVLVGGMFCAALAAAAAIDDTLENDGTWRA